MTSPARKRSSEVEPSLVVADRANARLGLAECEGGSANEASHLLERVRAFDGDHHTSDVVRAHTVAETAAERASKRGAVDWNHGDPVPRCGQVILRFHHGE